ncbi:MAG: hypothetical protein V4736_01755 [Bdellovibrionota bacterium]
MKTLLAIAALTVVSASAFGGVELKYRGDYLSTPRYTTRAVGTDEAARSEFRGNYAKLNANGKVGAAEAKVALNLLGYTAAGALSAGSFVDYLYISQPIADGMTFHAGKIETFLGGIEGAQDTLGNVYLNSLANCGYAGYYANAGVVRATTGGAAFSGGTGACLNTATNAHGVGFTYNYGMGQLDVIATNDSNNTAAQGAAAANPAQIKHNVGVQWSGSFMDGMIKPAIGYAKGSADAAGANSINYDNEHINAGFDMMWNEWGFTLEHLSNANTEKGTGVGAEDKDKVTSTYLAASFKMDAWKPFAKYEMSKLSDEEAGASAAATSFDRTGMSLGVEWTPRAGEAMSYHVAYLNTMDKYGTTVANSVGDVTFVQYVAGMRFSADLLK